MRILIVGAGVTGTLAAAALVEANADVTVLTRPSRQKQLLMAQSKITSPLGRFNAPIPAVTPEQLDGTFDAVILATRANVYQASLFVLQDVLTASTLLVPMFDGVHHLGYWRECYPINPVAIARTDVRARQDADAVVRQQAPIGDLKLGLITKHGTEPLDALCRLLDGRRVRAHVDADTVLIDVWGRSIYRAAAAGACLLSGMTLRDMVRFNGSKTFEAMIREGVRAGEAQEVWHLLGPASRYRTAFLRESQPVIAPEPIAAGGRAGSEALFLLANMLRQSQDADADARLLLRAWQATSKPLATACEHVA